VHSFAFPVRIRLAWSAVIALVILVSCTVVAFIFSGRAFLFTLVVGPFLSVLLLRQILTRRGEYASLLSLGGPAISVPWHANHVVRRRRRWKTHEVAVMSKPRLANLWSPHLWGGAIVVYRGPDESTARVAERLARRLCVRGQQAEVYLAQRRANRLGESKATSEGPAGTSELTHDASFAPDLATGKATDKAPAQSSARVARGPLRRECPWCGARVGVIIEPGPYDPCDLCGFAESESKLFAVRLSRFPALGASVVGVAMTAIVCGVFSVALSGDTIRNLDVSLPVAVIGAVVLAVVILTPPITLGVHLFKCRDIAEQLIIASPHGLRIGANHCVMALPWSHIASVASDRSLWGWRRISVYEEPGGRRHRWWIRARYATAAIEILRSRGEAPPARS
jgi:hypothetical protein